LNRLGGALAALLLFAAQALHAAAQTGPKDANPQAEPAGAAPALRSVLVSRAVIEDRLRAAPHGNADRKQALEAMFEQAGCKGASLTEQPVSRQDLPNVVCTLPGTTESTIIVSGHFDKVSRGDGVVDNWSGASLLPSLFEGLQNQSRRHTFVFVGFTAEEKGLAGSRFYVNQMTAEQVAETRAMVNMDTLGLGPTKLWLNHSDPKLAGALFAMAQSLKLSLAVMNADRVGDDDSDPFIRRGIPTLMVHSITRQTLHILHSSDDNLGAVSFGEHYDTYRLLAAYLAWIDVTLP